MEQKKVILVAGARPNFMKIAPLMRAFGAYSSIKPILVHTGQHYDTSMSKSFFVDLGIPEPDFNLEVGSGSHAVQTASIMMRFEEVLLRESPSMVIVVGDVNSTIAAALTAKKLHIIVAHVEAGLRSRDRDMPEEINRIATDAITDLFFTTEQEGDRNLLSEGVAPGAIHFVGHVMIDNLLYQLRRLESPSFTPATSGLKARLARPYICCTLHRPSNVDVKENLRAITEALAEAGKLAPVIFPCHPRTRKQIELFGMASLLSTIDSGTDPVEKGLYWMDPLGYNDFLYLWKDCAVMVTDSGGLQEETTALKIPCITMRHTTERPVTAQLGSNEVIGLDTVKMVELVKSALGGNWKSCTIPPLWDGRAGERIAEVVERKLIVDS